MVIMREFKILFTIVRLFLLSGMAFCLYHAMYEMVATLTISYLIAELIGAATHILVNRLDLNYAAMFVIYEKIDSYPVYEKILNTDLTDKD